MQSHAAPDFVQANVIVATACADSSILLISCAIDSASEQADSGRERDGSDIKTTKISSTSSHQDMISSLAVTWTASDTPNESTSRSRGSTDTTDEKQVQYSFLVASSSATGSGLLVVHRLPFSRHIGMQGHSPVIVARQFMRMPLLRSALGFNPASYPSTNHTSLLITSPARGIVKILDLSQSRSALKRRRASETEADNEEASAVPSANICLTLHAGYTSSSTLPRRVEILDARWAMNGKVIVALLEDGDWGIWDIEGVGIASHDDRRPAQGTRGNVVQGKFAVCGNISTGLQRTKTIKTKSSGSLAPMTPHTRKRRSADLFGSSEPRADAKTATKSAGRISICTQQEAVAGADDAIVISFDGSNSFIPSLRSLHQPERQGNAVIAGRTTRQVQALPSVRLGGETQMAISPFHAPKRKSNPFPGLSSIEQGLIILTKSRLILHTKPEPKSVVKSAALNLPLRSAHGDDSTFASRLTNNEVLDLDAMDKMLESMDNIEDQQNSPIEARINLPFQQTSQTQVGDLDMASPSMPKSTKSKLIISRDAASRRQNLFD